MIDEFSIGKTDDTNRGILGKTERVSHSISQRKFPGFPSPRSELFRNPRQM